MAFSDREFMCRWDWLCEVCLEFTVIMGDTGALEEFDWDQHS